MIPCEYGDVRTMFMVLFSEICLSLTIILFTFENGGLISSLVM